MAFEPEGLLLSRETIEDIITEACQAPSEYNLQPWRFLVVRDRERKQALYDCAFKQEKIRQASALIIVCGDTRGWERAETAAAELMAASAAFAAESGGSDISDINDQNGIKALAERIKGVYVRNEWARMALAIRNPALVAMNIMLLATERGIASCPIGGFSEPHLRKAFDIPERYIPVLVIALGMPALDAGRPALKPRRPISEVVFHEDMSAWSEY